MKKNLIATGCVRASRMATEVSFVVSGRDLLETSTKRCAGEWSLCLNVRFMPSKGNFLRTLAGSKSRATAELHALVSLRHPHRPRAAVRVALH